jgi:hypothetical protein
MSYQLGKENVIDLVTRAINGEFFNNPVVHRDFLADIAFVLTSFFGGQVIRVEPDAEDELIMSIAREDEETPLPVFEQYDPEAY